VDHAIKIVVDSGRFIGGPEVEKFENFLADMIGTNFAVSVSSGTDALLSSMMAIGIGPGDEVITSPFTFFATAGAIARTGATPVFADINENTFVLDPPGTLSKVTKATKAIIPVHLFGLTAPVEPYFDGNIPVIEDAAQALLSEGIEGAAGSIGIAGCF
jgi:dTDP-4-amino-4,6-dideoxygalactose transaminase